MATIEERAKILADVATDIDRIARQEERERCIKAAQEWLMDFLGDTDPEHPTIESLRKAMEGGEG